MRRAAVVGFAALGAVAVVSAAVWYSLCSRDPAAAARGAGTRDPAAGGSERWFDVAARAGTVRLVVAPPPGAASGAVPNEVVLQPLGPLTGPPRDELAERFKIYETGAVAQLARFRESMDESSVDDLIVDAQLLRAREIVRAQRAMIEHDRYVVLPEGQIVPPAAIPDGALHYRQNLVATDRGVVDVHFVVVIDEHPELVEAFDYSRTVSDYYDETKVSEFNALAPVERRRRYREHAAAEEALRKGPPAETRGESARQAWESELRARTVSPEFRIDPETYSMSRVGDADR